MSELNLLPYELKAKRLKELKKNTYISYIVVVFAILFAIVYIPKLYVLKLERDTEKYSNYISGDSKIMIKNKKLLGDIENYKIYNDKVDFLTKQKVDVTDKIKNLQKYISKDIILTNLTYSKGVITINGITSNYNSISAFAANLQMSEEYKKAKIINISDSDNKDLEKQGKYVFTISISE